MVKLSTSRIKLSSILILWACGALFFSASPAFAQFDAALDPAEEDAIDGLPELDEDDPLYWAQMRDIYTVQKRAFQKEGRFALSFYGGLIPNNIFERYVPMGVRINYYLLENLGVELAGSYALKFDTPLSETVRDGTGIGAASVLIGDTQISHTNFGIVWSPFYGKLAFHNRGLVYFDMYLFGGVGMVITETQPDTNLAAESNTRPEGALGGGLALYFGNHFGVRADFRQFVFEKVARSGVANPSEVSLGLSLFF